jgi:ADP-dependent NAD(P)H-hydrate dehydratase / NAD(P)H-hydrate epimerase
MKLFRSDQIKLIDELTIRNEPVASVDLMERAANQLFQWISERYERSACFHIFTGSGNNGGDGLALARILARNRFKTRVWHVRISDKESADWIINQKRLEKETDIILNILEKEEHFPLIRQNEIIIDALFGSGLSRPVDGLAASVIKLINNCKSNVISVDIPSGLFCEDNSSNTGESIVKADYTLSFQFPKLSFMFPENERYIGDWHILPIGLDINAIAETASPFNLVDLDLIKPLLKKRNKFDHKGKFGNGILVAGSSGKMGAAILSAKAALKSGIGLITCYIPQKGSLVMQGYLPEAMVVSDKSETRFSGIDLPDNYSAAGVGPGLGVHQETQDALHNLLMKNSKPIVLDADALNIISLNKEWFSLLNENSVITPHLKEFERLAGSSTDGYARLKKQIALSEKYKCVIVLKGANTSITDQKGKVWFNSTGNPGMATAGSGDVLTGIILSLLAQGYKPFNAAITGVYLHGLAGDIATEKLCQESIIASDIIDGISSAYNRIRETE